MTVTLGSDPEVFFVSEKDGSPVMAIGHVGGCKDEPRPLGVGSVQEDNVCAEFCIPPQSDEDGWVEVHMAMLEEVGKLAKEAGAKILIQPALNFTQEQLMSEPMAMRLGCEPDISVYGRPYNIPVAQQVLRTAGGHVHVGSELAKTNPEAVIRAMDLFLGFPAIHGQKQEMLRTRMYGGYGKYREKEYGVEYRTLSNFWLQDEAKMRWVWRNTMRALEWAEEHTEYNAHYDPRYYNQPTFRRVMKESPYAA